MFGSFGAAASSRQDSSLLGLPGGFEPNVVLEEINTLPYLSPFWSKAPSSDLYEPARAEVWWYEAPLAVAAAVSR